MRLTLDDRGQLAELAASLAKAGAATAARAAKVTRHYGVILQARVQAGASGRPGPRAPTGDYRRSISLRYGPTLRGGYEASVGTNRPQGRRLELGFKGTDSLGRSYDQPAYAHFGPAFDKTRPEFEKAVAELGVDLVEDL